MANAQATLQERLADGSLAGNWVLDPARSTAALRSKSLWGLAPVKGVFHDLEGQGTVSAAGEVNGRLVVAAGSVDTKNKKRDTHLRSDEFFSTDKHPTITFELGTLAPTADGTTMSGTLTVAGTQRPISFPATVALQGDSEAALDAVIQVDRSDFGLNWNQLGMASMKNTITIHAVFTRS